MAKSKCETCKHKFICTTTPAIDIKKYILFDCPICTSRGLSQSVGSGELHSGDCPRCYRLWHGDKYHIVYDWELTLYGKNDEKT